MNDLYENIEMKQLTPKFLYSMEAIGEISLKGWTAPLSLDSSS